MNERLILDLMQKLSPQDQQDIDAYLDGIAEIISRNTEPESLQTFEQMELTAREWLLGQFGPAIMQKFFPKPEPKLSDAHEK